MVCLSLCKRKDALANKHTEETMLNAKYMYMILAVYVSMCLSIEEFLLN